MTRPSTFVVPGLRPATSGSSREARTRRNHVHGSLHRLRGSHRHHRRRIDRRLFRPPSGGAARSASPGNRGPCPGRHPQQRSSLAVCAGDHLCRPGRPAQAGSRSRSGHRGRHPRCQLQATVTGTTSGNVAIVVEDLDAAVAFFTELGMEPEGEAQVEGLWAERSCEQPAEVLVAR